MSDWAGIETELYGVKRAAENLKDCRELADYIYDRQCAYMGADHESVAVALIDAGLQARLRERTDRGRVDDALYGMMMARLHGDAAERLIKEEYAGRGGTSTDEGEPVAVDALLLADWVIGWWPGVEDAFNYWPNPEKKGIGKRVYKAAKRILDARG